jgi:hypothetical protein
MARRRDQTIAFISCRSSASEEQSTAHVRLDLNSVYQAVTGCGGGREKGRREVQRCGGTLLIRNILLFNAKHTSLDAIIFTSHIHFNPTLLFRMSSTTPITDSDMENHILFILHIRSTPYMTVEVSMD